MDLENLDLAAILVLAVFVIGYANKVVDALRPIVKESPATWDDKVLAVVDKALAFVGALLSAFNVLKQPGPKK